MENNLSQEENKYMVLNNAESIKHHAEELENAAKKSKHIPAWAVAKIYNASENLSGVTHFIDSSNKMPKEQYERIQEQINEEVKNEYAQGGGIEDYIQLQSNIGLICNKNGVTLKDYHEAKKFYTGGVIDSCETIVNGERQIDADSINKLTECVMNLPQTKSYYLDSKGNYTSSRKQLHKKIINQVKKGVVCIDKGKPIAVLMGGSPASGKTTFLKKYRPYLLSESIFKVDADEIRSMLPEYKGYNASQTHEETSDIVNTLISDKNIGIPCEFDFIYDGTMSSPKKYFKLVELLKNLGYEVFIIFMNGITEKTAKERALQRYKKSGRFVPMSVIEDFFRNGKETLNKLKNLVDGYIVVDGSTPEYNIIEQRGIRLPNERIYEELGNVKLKEGGNTTRKDVVRDTKNKLSKAFTLPIEMSVYVPSTASANEEISEEEFNDRIEEVEVYLSNLFGGFSKVDISGGYNSEEKGLIQESVAKVTAFATKKSFEENKNKLIEKLSYWCKEWGQESMGYEFEGDLYYIDKNFKLENGGGVKYYNKENEYRLSRPSSNIEKEILDRVTFKESMTNDMFVGSFGWKTPQGKIAEGYLYKLDDFDKNLIKNVSLKSDEKVFRYVNRATAIGGMMPFIKINLEKSLLYFLIHNENDDIIFETRGVNAMFINIIEDKMAHGGGVDVKIPPQGTMISKDKKNKIDYKKVGNNYELIVYEGEPNAVENYSRTSFKKKSNGVVTMNYNQFINYIYTEGYVDDKMSKGGAVEENIKKSIIDILKELHSFSNKIKFRTEWVNGIWNIVYDDPKGETEYLLKRLRNNKFWNTDFAPTTGKFPGGRVNITFDKSAQEILNVEKFDKKDWLSNQYAKGGGVGDKEILEGAVDFLIANGYANIIENDEGNFVVSDLDDMDDYEAEYTPEEIIYLAYTKGYNDYDIADYSKGGATMASSMAGGGMAVGVRNWKTYRSNEWNSKLIEKLYKEYYGWESSEGKFTTDEDLKRIIDHYGATFHQGKPVFEQVKDLMVNSGWVFGMKTGGATTAQKRKVGKVMHEWKAGKLHSGSKKGPIVKDQKQAVAIALSEAGLNKKENGGLTTSIMSKGGLLTKEEFSDWLKSRSNKAFSDKRVWDIYERGNNRYFNFKGQVYGYDYSGKINQIHSLKLKDSEKVGEFNFDTKNKKENGGSVDRQNSKPIKAFKINSLKKIFNNIGFPTTSLEVYNDINAGPTLSIQFKNTLADENEFIDAYTDFQFDGGSLGSWLPDIISAYHVGDNKWKFQMQK